MAKQSPVPEIVEQDNTLVRSADSTHPQSGVHLEPGLPCEFGRYRLLKLLGKGGMGAVYLGHDSQLDRQVAIKMPTFAPKAADATRERFRREARLAATLEHENICRVYDFGEIDGQAFLSMAYIEGVTLADLIRQGKKLKPQTVANLMQRIASAVHFAHSRGVIHRDLKPANIMLRPDKSFVIMDFGLARKVTESDQDLTNTGAVLGTPAYMSPEQLRGESLTPATDVYSLGVMLYELLVGERPYRGTIPQIYAQILTGHSISPQRAVSSVPDELDSICRRATQIDLNLRYTSAQDFGQALIEAMKSMTASKDDAQLLTLNSPDIYAKVTAVPVAAPKTEPGVSAQRPLRALSNPSVIQPRPLVKPRKSKPSSGLLTGLAMLIVGFICLAIIVIVIVNKDGTKTVIKADAKAIEIHKEEPKPDRPKAADQPKPEASPAKELDKSSEDALVVINVPENESPSLVVPNKGERFTIPQPGEKPMKPLPAGTGNIPIPPGSLTLPKDQPAISQDEIVAALAKIAVVRAREERDFQVDIRGDAGGHRQALILASQLPLYSLQLTSCQLNSQDFDLLSKASALQEFSLARCSGITRQHLEKLTCQATLFSLSLLESTLNDEGLLPLQQFKAIIRLEISSTQCTRRGVLNLTPQLPMLQHLEVRNLNLVDDDIAVLTRQSLLTLSLSGNPELSDYCLPFIARVPKLQRLDLGGTRVTESGILELLGTVPIQQSLLRLNLADSVAGTDRVCRLLADLPNLEGLWLERTRVSDQGLQYLEKKSNLAEIWLYDCPISPAAVNRFKQALPKTNIFF